MISKEMKKILESMLDKGKGPVLEKIENVILIEGDLQTNVRIHLNSDKEELIEADDRFST